MSLRIDSTICFYKSLVNQPRQREDLKNLSDSLNGLVHQTEKHYRHQWKHGLSRAPTLKASFKKNPKPFIYEIWKILLQSPQDYLHWASYKKLFDHEQLFI